MPRNVKNRCFRHSGHFLCHKIRFIRLHAVSSHEAETGNHWKMADSVIRSGFFVSVAWHEMSRTLVFAFRGNVLTRPSLHPVPPCRPGLIRWRRPRWPARRGRIPLSENALAQTGAGTATVVLLMAIMALIDVGVYDICRVDSGLPKRFGRELSDAALTVACRNASVRRMIRRVV